MTITLVALLAAALGWTCGHSTARIRIINVGATAREDDNALMTQAIRDLNDACCDLWWTTTGLEHDSTCPNHKSHRSAA
ncbi:hypothetical protein ACFYWS_39440 [Streptomyces sp. NPDC002795]|uniref:hypothetical protein n=1 Tax=Streptomyces sp. NPDC002795 TaxID=3364665 RepID=UPI0036B93EFF